MKFWIDAQLPPALAGWLVRLGSPDAIHLSEMGLLRADDRDIFRRAREAKAALITKDLDFVQLLQQYGSPPHVVWITAGNIGNEELESLVAATWPRILELLSAGEPLVEIARQSRPDQPQ